MLIANVALLVASDAPAGVEDRIAPLVERTKQRQRQWLADETGYRFDYKLDVLRSRFDAAHFLSKDDGTPDPDACGHGMQPGRLQESLGIPGNHGELNWPWAADGGPHRCYRRDIVYVGQGPNGYAGGKGNYDDRTDRHDGTGEDYGEAFYGGYDYWHLAGLGSRDCFGRLFPNLRLDSPYAPSHSHEGLHHWGIECHRKLYTPAAAMTFRAIAQALGIGVRQVVENQESYPLPAGLTLMIQQSPSVFVNYLTAERDTLTGIWQRRGDPRRHWGALLDDVPQNVETLAGVTVPAGVSIWYPGALWLGEPLQAFQREMFIAHNPRWLEKVPVPLPNPDKPPETPLPPVEPLVVTPASAIVHRYFGKRSATLTANKPISLVKALHPHIVQAVQTGERTVKVTPAPGVRPSGTRFSGGLLGQVAVVAGAERLFVPVIVRW
jgi:hypothetical protein